MAPNAMARSKSPLMPIDRPRSPLRAAILANNAKCNAGSSVHRGDAHQTGIGKSMPRQSATKSICVCGHNPGFLRFFASVDLNEQFGACTGFLRETRKGCGQLGPVERMNGLKQLHRLTRLVGLQRPDEMQINTRERLPEYGPFSGSFLHPVFAK